jgi:hypothetical protein
MGEGEVKMLLGDEKYNKLQEVLMKEYFEGGNFV